MGFENYGRLVNNEVVSNYTGCLASECKVYRMIDGVKTLVSVIPKAEEWKAIERDDYVEPRTKRHDLPVLVIHPGSRNCRLTSGVALSLHNPCGYVFTFDTKGIRVQAGEHGRKGFVCHRGAVPKAVGNKLKSILQPDNNTSYYIIGRFENGALCFCYGNAIAYHSKKGNPPWEGIEYDI